MLNQGGTRNTFPSLNRRPAFEAADYGLYALGPVRHFTQNARIFSEGDNADNFLKVVAGVVRSCKIFSDGRRQIDAFYVPDDVFGFEFGAEYSLSAEAVCDCTVISYRWPGLEMLAANNQGLSLQLFSYMIKNLGQAQQHARLLASRSALEKMVSFLLMWAEHSGNSSVADLLMSRQDIADYLGLTVETVSRTLSYLKGLALIELASPREIYLKDIVQLQLLCG